MNPSRLMYLVISLALCVSGCGDDDLPLDADVSMDAQSDATIERCGDGRIDPGEACDGTELDGRSCMTEGFAAGELSCSADCQNLVIDTCSEPCRTPRLHFSDIDSGPATGNSDPVVSEHGSVVTMWGANLGPMRPDSKVLIEDSTGMIHEAGHIHYWKNADGQLPSGPADLYKYHRMQEIALSIPAAAASGLARIHVEVDGVASNALPFTVRPGSIYFVDNAGDDGAGDGSWSNPWQTLDHAVDPAFGELSAGDILYVRDYTDTNSVDIGGLTNPYVGTAETPFVIASYPGDYLNYISNVDSPTADNRNVNFARTIRNKWGGNDHWNFSKLRLETNWDGFDAFLGMRVIANEIFGLHAEGTGGAVTGGGDSTNDVAILGNHVHDFGNPDTSSLHHIFYLSNRDGTPNRPYELGWNLLENNGAPHGLHIFDQSTCGDWVGTFRIHDNVVANQRGCGVQLQGSCSEGQGRFSYDAEIYNNLFINDPESPTQGTPVCINSSMLDGRVKIFNNSVFGFGGKAIVLGNQFPGDAEVFNNVVVHRGVGDAFVSETAPGESAANIFFSTDPMIDLPSWTGSTGPEPVFVNSDSLDFGLTPASPGVDEGQAVDLLYDLIGNPRPVGEMDIGAYEVPTMCTR